MPRIKFSLNNMEDSIESSTDEKSNFSFISAFNQVLSDFLERSKNITMARYGIDAKEPKTLEKIGNEHKITRERVRQIIREVLKKARLAKSQSVISEIIQKIAFTIGEKNGIIEKENLISIVGKRNSNEMAAARFFLDYLKNFSEIEIKGELKKSYILPDFNVEEWKKIKNASKNILELEKKTLTDDELESKISSRAGMRVPPQKIFDYLAVSEEIEKNSFGKWGLAEWDEINPRGTREKVHLVLKETGKPLHFQKISELIDFYKLNRRKTHPQTVHNELIKDNRFVLVGRGTYALSEWGYKKGTVKEILEEILKSHLRPMKKEDILNQVLKTRQVKKSTVMINLNNFFIRTGKDGYTVRK